MEDAGLDIGLKKREIVLTYALLMENCASIFLSKLLGIEKYQDTISLGNKNSGLSFNQKINLLIDIGALSKDQQNKFQTFMEIRNQFMHNLTADSYESCFDCINGKEKFILKLYPQNDKLVREDKLEKATSDLANETLKISLELFEKVREKVKKEVRSEMLEEIQPLLWKKLEEFGGFKKT